MDKALKRFRFIAYLAGVILIIFTIEIIIKYTLGPEIPSSNTHLVLKFHGLHNFMELST